MCGIAGLAGFGTRKEREGLVIRMIQRIRHRGPDATGIRSEGDLCLGHARLKVIDLTGGHQPMYRDDLRATIVFNGEIYNYVELREELENRGHRFATTSDTEVLLTAYREWSSHCVTKLRGMFAFVVHDHTEGSLFGARDRFGKKPLVYWHSKDQFAFASELKALLGLPFVDRSVDPVALCAYLEQLYVPEQCCIFQAMHKVPPGHTFTWRPGEFHVDEYWSPHFQQNGGIATEEVQCRMDSVLNDAVRVRLRSDVPLGIFLSGGIDSSLVAVSAAAQLGRPLKTYSVRMPGAEDETPNAAQVARIIGSDHTVIEIPPPRSEDIIAVAESFDEPFADSSAVPMSMMSRVAKQYVTVVLSGDGGDELFGGYGIYQGHAKQLEEGRATRSGRSSPLWRSIRAGLPAGIEKRIRHVIPDIASFFPGAFRKGDDDILVRHCQRQAIYYEPALRRLLRPEWHSFLDDGITEQRLRVRDSRSDLNRVFEYDVRNYLVADILKKVDMTTMAWGLESRAPLLDGAVADLSMRLSPAQKVTSTQTKIPLKTLLARRVGRDFVNRTKTGFGAPVGQWLQEPAMRTVICDLFESSALCSGDWIDMRAARKLVRRVYDGRSYLGQPLWNILMLEIWSRKYLRDGVQA
jgi:asparagine synthase (glutamine-hydrolysing)